MLLVYFVTVDLVTSPLITALLRRIAYAIADGKVIKYPFNGPLSGTTRVSQYQKGKTNLDFSEARDSEWPPW